jgi:hypothetical protein
VKQEHDYMMMVMMLMMMIVMSELTVDAASKTLGSKDCTSNHSKGGNRNKDA